MSDQLFPHYTNPGVDSYKQKILPLRDRMTVYNGWLKNRLETILPKLMDEIGIEMWLVIAREYNEDPVIMSLLPMPNLYARRRTILLFHRKPDKVERLAVYRYGFGDFYEGVWNPDEEEQYEALTRIIKERDPNNIGINVSNTYAFGDGLTHGEYTLLIDALGSLSDRIVPAETLCVRWLETRIKEELETYPMLVELTHAIIQEAFSSKVITPGVTTTNDVQWWMRQKMLDLGVEMWFPATVDLQGHGDTYDAKEKRKLIKRGDLIHCDVGFYYLGLATDVQQNCYILKHGETDAPAGLKDALTAANQLQDFHAEAMKTGRTGNEILKIALDNANKVGLTPSIYTHPLGVHGHAAGPTIGLWDQQDGVLGRGDHPLHPDTCYAIELNAKHKVPEWDHQEVRMALEQDAWWTGEKLVFMSGRQKKLHLVN
ncbi:MAG: aminopeptidase P family protein [Candidatus Bathyarchaeota archaeon]|nr:aminopeptidase P family protein [Candidatus Bathyarchaeota archaeon]